MVKKLFFYTLCLGSLAMTACEDEKSGNGTISLRVTDAPTDAENIAGVYITFDRVDYRHEGEWHEFEAFEGPKTVNLLELTEGKTELLGDFEVEAGNYSELRFHLDASQNGGNVTNPATYIAFADGSTQPLYVPSGTQSGYKAKGEFVVPVNGTVFITADFDVRKSVVLSGASGKWILKPVIRLVVNDQAGTLEGTFEGAEAGLEYIAYAYANDAYTEAEAAIPAEGEVQFPNAVSSTKLNADGTFRLSFLAPGIYDLVIAAYTNGEFQEVIGQYEDVEVTSLQTTPVRVEF